MSALLVYENVTVTLVEILVGILKKYCRLFALADSDVATVVFCLHCFALEILQKHFLIE